ncbi:hypothetical protein [Phormidesmis priestleyi]
MRENPLLNAIFIDEIKTQFPLDCFMKSLSLLKVRQSVELWLSKRKAPLAIAGVVIALILFVKVGEQAEWTGMGADQTVSTAVETDSRGNVVRTVTTTTPQSGKTLWDVLSLVGVPASLALLAWWLQEQQQRRSYQQVQQEKEIAESNRKEEALQDFIDRISQLLIEKNLIAIAAQVNPAMTHQLEQSTTLEETTTPNVDTDDLSKDVTTDEQRELLNAAKDIIQARTLSILRRLGNDSERKAAVMKFLAEADVIEKVGLELERVDLSGVDLSSTNLKGINLSFANRRVAL